MKFSYDNYVFAFDVENRIGYFWKGDYAEEFDEFYAKEIIDKFKEKFGDLEFRIFDSLEFKEEDNESEKLMKYQILKNLPNKTVWKLKRNLLSIIKFKNLKSKINEFKSYEKSWNWRRKLLNLYSLSKLINIIVILIAAILLFNPMILNLNSGALALFIVFLLLLGLTVINLIFILFPMKLPGILYDFGLVAKPSSISGEKIKKAEKSIKPSQPKLPPSPVLPPSKEEKKLKPHQIEIQIPGLEKPSVPQKKGKTKEKVEDEFFDEDLDLGIPEVPVAPPKQSIKLDAPGVSPELVEKVTKGETKEVKYILVKCDRCEEIIAVPVPKKKVIDSELPVVPISYVHGKGKKIHVLTIHIDHDFDVRRRRISDVAIEK